MRKLLLVLVLGLLLPIGSCVKSDDGNTYIDPVVAEKVEDAADGAVSTMTLLLPLLPWLAPFVAAGGGILGTWKKLKPKLTEAERDNDNLAWGGEILAAVLDDVKKNHPETWKKIGPEIHKAIKSSVSIENAIREFRHLAPKE